MNLIIDIGNSVAKLAFFVEGNDGREDTFLYGIPIAEVRELVQSLVGTMADFHYLVQVENCKFGYRITYIYY